MAALSGLAGCGLGVGVTLLWQRLRAAPALPAPSFSDELAVKALGSLNLNLIGIGDELGLFKALADGPLRLPELAAKTGCDERYLQEWCLHMYATKILNCLPDGRFEMLPGIREVVHDASAFSLAYTVPASIATRDRLVKAYKTGEGIGWGDHDHRLFCGTRLFFQPFYEKHLIPNVPAEIKSLFDGGCKVADIGCGEGVSCAVLAEAFPNIRLTGFDFHAPSLQCARTLCAKKGLTNVTFVEGCASDFGAPGEYDVVTFFDCFHDMAPATAAAKRAFSVLTETGYVWLIEPLASETDCVHEQVKFPTTSMMSGFSCHVCLPSGKCDGGDALGTVAPTCRHRDIFVKQAGFKNLVSIQSPFNSLGFRVLLARK